MKTVDRFSAVIVLLILAFSVTGLAQKDRKLSRHEKKQSGYEQMKKLIESRDFIFSATRAFPSGWRSIDLITNPGTIIIKEDSVVADLPFFGRSYMGSYQGEAGLKFSGTSKEEELKFIDKKYNVRYSFRVTSGSDTYKVYMDVTYDGDASVTIDSNNRATISYHGKIEDRERNKKQALF